MFFILRSPEQKEVERQSEGEVSAKALQHSNSGKQFL